MSAVQGTSYDPQPIRTCTERGIDNDIPKSGCSTALDDHRYSEWSELVQQAATASMIREGSIKCSVELDQEKTSSADADGCWYVVKVCSLKSPRLAYSG